MRLVSSALALAVGIVCAIAILLVGLVSMGSDYGDGFLDSAASLYPGYANDGSFGDVVVGALYGLLGGAICGFLFAALYNKLTRHHKGIDWMVGGVDW